MALFTTADRDAVKAAMITALTAGVASVSIAGQSVHTYTLDELRRLLEAIQADLATAQPHFGMRMVKLVPPGAG